MLVITRKVDEAIWIDDQIRIQVIEVRGRIVRLGIEAPREYRVLREELCEDQLVASAEGSTTATTDRGD